MIRFLPVVVFLSLSKAQSPLSTTGGLTGEPPTLQTESPAPSLTVSIHLDAEAVQTLPVPATAKELWPAATAFFAGKHKIVEGYRQRLPAQCNTNDRGRRFHDPTSNSVGDGGGSGVRDHYAHETKDSSCNPLHVVALSLCEEMACALATHWRDELASAVESRSLTRISAVLRQLESEVEFNHTTCAPPRLSPDLPIVGDNGSGGGGALLPGTSSSPASSPSSPSLKVSSRMKVILKNLVWVPMAQALTLLVARKEVHPETSRQFIQILERAASVDDDEDKDQVDVEVSDNDDDDDDDDDSAVKEYLRHDDHSIRGTLLTARETFGHSFDGFEERTYAPLIGELTALITEKALHTRGGGVNAGLEKSQDPQWRGGEEMNEADAVEGGLFMADERWPKDVPESEKRECYVNSILAAVDQARAVAAAVAAAVAPQPSVTQEGAVLRFRALEVGFNGGHSAALLLSSTSNDGGDDDEGGVRGAGSRQTLGSVPKSPLRPHASRAEVSLSAFDLCAHAYTLPAAKHLNKVFPGRLDLTCGDSQVTLWDLVNHQANVTEPRADLFDFAFVDGLHTTETTLSDLRAARQLSRRGATVVLDDCPSPPVLSAWAQLVREGLISPKHPGICWRGMCIGTFA